MGERLAQARIVVAELPLSDLQVLPGGSALCLVGVDQAVEGVHQGTRPRVTR